MITFIVVTSMVIVMIGMEWKEIHLHENKQSFLVFTSLLSIGIILWILRGLDINIGDPVSLMQKLNVFYSGNVN